MHRSTFASSFNFAHFPFFTFHRQILSAFDLNKNRINRNQLDNCRSALQKRAIKSRLVSFEWISALAELIWQRQRQRRRAARFVMNWRDWSYEQDDCVERARKSVLWEGEREWQRTAAECEEAREKRAACSGSSQALYILVTLVICVNWLAEGRESTSQQTNWNAKEGFDWRGVLHDGLLCTARICSCGIHQQTNEDHLDEKGVKVRQDRNKR